MTELTFNWPLFNVDEDERRHRLRQLADTGICNIVLNNSLIENAIVSPEICRKYILELKEYGLKFVDAHAPWGTWKDPGMPLEEYHEQVVLRQKMAIRICNECGVRTMAFHTGNTFNSIFGKKLKLDDYYRMLLRSLEELLPDAERLGVILSLENQWTPLNQSECLISAVRHFDSRWLGICYDAGHANLVEKGINFPNESCVPSIWNDADIPVVWEENMVERLQPWIVNCHLHDNNGIIDQHNLPGCGTVDWKRIMAALKAAPRLENIQSEVKISQDCNPNMALLKGTFDNLLSL